MLKIYSLFILFLLLFNAQPLQAQDSAHIYKNRLLTIGIGGGVMYGTTLYLFDKAWYSGFPRSSFHFFNDNREWLQMDKCGHACASYYEGVFGIKVMKWAG